MMYVGKVDDNIKKLLGITSSTEKIIKSKGFEKHLEKSNHRNMFAHLDKINDILSNPDYVGVNPREKDTSLEYVKIYEDNLLIGVKLDRKNDYFYLATMHEISDLKLGQRVKNGRLIKFDK